MPVSFFSLKLIEELLLLIILKVIMKYKKYPDQYETVNS